MVPLPGPSSIMAALSVSGFYADQYVSYGFLPAGSARRRRLLGQIAEQQMAAVLFETPHRLRGALEDMANVLNDRKLVICREMTKLHEEIWCGTAVEALDYFSSPRGEFVIVVAPLGRTEQRPSATDVEDAERRILEAASEFEEQHSSRRDLVAAVAERTGLPKRQVYQALHRNA